MKTTPKTYQEFLYELIGKNDNSYNQLKDARPYTEYRNLASLVIDEIERHHQGKWYQQNKRAFRHLIKDIVATILYIQSLTKNEKTK